MNIRKYSANDTLDCINIFLSNRPKYFAVHELELFKKWLDKNEKNYYILEEDGKAAGCCGFEVRNHCAFIAWHMVHNDLHEKGHGSAILNYTLKRIISKVNWIALDTSQHTYKFYEKFSFRVDKIIKNYYAKGLDRYDMSMQVK